MSARNPVWRTTPLNLKLIRNVLEFEGFDVLTARSGEEGVAVASSGHVDQVRTDLQLVPRGGELALSGR